MFQDSFRSAFNRAFATVILIGLSAGAAWAGGYKVIHSFGRLTRTPSSGLVLDKAGNAYGTTAGDFVGGGPGTVYQISPTTGYHLIYGFSGSPDGRQPEGNLTIDDAGNIYGTTFYGGANKSGCNNHGCGTVFRLSPPTNGGAWTETVLYSFSGGDDGANPPAGVIVDSKNNLYGAATNGGNLGAGTVFQLSPGGNGQWTQTVIYTMNDGAFPLGGLTFDGSGNIYGTTSLFGGGAGTVFELSPPQSGQDWTYTRLYSFAAHGGNDGGIPAAGVVFDELGSLFGTTSVGGDFGLGTVFELTFDGANWAEKIIHSFAGGSDGAMPLAAPVLDPAGDVYGTTYAGGSGGTSCLGNGCGTAFELIPSHDGKWIERRFIFPGDGSLGRQPTSPLLLDELGRAYGTTTSAGPTGGGVIFRITP